MSEWHRVNNRILRALHEIEDKRGPMRESVQVFREFWRAMTNSRATSSGVADEAIYRDGSITVRGDGGGSFHELISGPVFVHLEMMDDHILWGALYPEADRRFVIWITAERGILQVRVENDG